MAHQHAAPNAAAATASVHAAPAAAALAGPTREYSETDTVALEWKVAGVNKLFESSKGDTKSRVVKSVLFGGGKWQILFYPNAGGTAQEYCSLYLSCEPACDEYEDAPSWPNSSSGKWTRPGTYSFRFSISATDGKTICQKEAANHTFTSKTANWGWAQYGKRDVVYFNNAVTRSNDVFTIHCSISSSAFAPVPPPSIPQQLVPRDLLSVIGRLLNDQSYSDVEFFIAAKNSGGREGQSIWANRTLLSRAEYFDTMLKSGFAEDLDQGGMKDDESMASVFATDLEDSDAEDDNEDASSMDNGTDEEEDDEDEHSSSRSEDGEDGTSSMSGAGMYSDGGGGRDEESTFIDEEGTPPAAKKLKLPEVPKEPEPEMAVSVSTKSSLTKTSKEIPERGGPKKTRIVVRDSSYTTFYALLFYLYTDSIHFAPLTSSFVTPSTPFSLSQSQSIAGSVQSATSSSFAPGPFGQVSGGGGGSSASNQPARARRAWIATWARNHPSMPAPASAKSIYVLADKMGLAELKKKAFDHIVSQLSVANIPYEAFSAFSAAYDEVRKCQVDYFLKNWTEIKKTDGMNSIWMAIRSGRHSGFEDVWPLIISQLEYVPQAREKDSKATAAD